MTDTEINIAIAEACGWAGPFQTGPWDGSPFGTSPEGQRVQCVPSYTTDLNAMHEAEMVLTHEQYHHIYIPELERVCLRDKSCMYSATAKQRAEAFLRTIGKWKE